MRTVGSLVPFAAKVPSVKGYTQVLWIGITGINIYQWVFDEPITTTGNPEPVCQMYRTNLTPGWQSPSAFDSSGTNWVKYLYPPGVYNQWRVLTSPTEIGFPSGPLTVPCGGPLPWPP